MQAVHSYKIRMSDLKLSLEEELPSPDLFSDPEIGTNISVAGTSDESKTVLANYKYFFNYLVTQCVLVFSEFDICRIC